MATQWVKNNETGLSWEVDEEHAKRLLGQRTADGDAEYSKTSAPKASKSDESKGTAAGSTPAS